MVSFFPQLGAWTSAHFGSHEGASLYAPFFHVGRRFPACARTFRRFGQNVVGIATITEATLSLVLGFSRIHPDRLPTLGSSPFRGHSGVVHDQLIDPTFGEKFWVDGTFGFLRLGSVIICTSLSGAPRLGIMRDDIVDGYTRLCWSSWILARSRSMSFGGSNVVYIGVAAGTEFGGIHESTLDSSSKAGHSDSVNPWDDPLKPFHQ